MTDTIDWTGLEKFARRLAEAAGAAILPHFRAPIHVDDKPGMRDFDPVTEADRAGEAAMRALIAAHYPDHGILGEEYGTERPNAEFVWVLDPIDGTRGFVAGLPTWTVLVALQYRGQPVIGLIAQPYIGELFAGRLIPGTPPAAHWAKGALGVRACPGLAQATLTSTGTSWFSADQLSRFQALQDAVRLPRFGHDAYGYAMLAMGFIDVVAECGLKAYDIAALIPVVEGAGGRVTDWQGGRDFTRGEVLATGDPRVHDAALTLLAKA
ncbi:histidinol-phosphatase [Rhodothalassium salexigens]|uniref:histidinol-phosphatase n=1 Tax=Rhodothalassium salexigens TaxID=1086 RepID=UPI001914A19B|nr:histidinol-phosphatase [Rhodothalassium salexigens]MBK5911251.1 histidinol-phosphatase [Rhodothalassium salexigens]